MRQLSIFLAIFLLCSELGWAQVQRGFNIGPRPRLEEVQRLVSKFNVNVVRYQLFWVEKQADSASEVEFNLWLDQELNYFESLLPVFAQAGIGVILDLHTPPGGFSSYDPVTHRLFVASWAQQAFVSVWQAIAQRYKDNPNIWAFDLLNEPAQPSVTVGLKDLNQLLQDTAQAIRAIDPSRRLIVQPIHGLPRNLRKLNRLPLEDVIYSIHPYAIRPFDHQGLEKFKYPRKYPNKKKKWNRKKIKRFLKGALRFAKKHKVSVYLGEFSVVCWAPEKAAVRYLRDLFRIVEKKGWHWTYHSFGENNVWSVEHSCTLDDQFFSDTQRAALLSKYFALN